MFHPLPPGSTSRAADGTIQQLPPSEPLLLGRPPLPFKATTSTPTQGASSLYPHHPDQPPAQSNRLLCPACWLRFVSYLRSRPVTVLLSLSEVVCSVLPVVRCVYYLPVPKSFAPSCLLAPFRLLPPFSPSHRITFPFRSRLLHPACCPLCLLPSRSEVVCSVLPVGSVSSLTSVLAQSPCRLRRDSPRLVRSFVSVIAWSIATWSKSLATACLDPCYSTSLASPFAAAMSHPVSFGVAASHQSGPLQNDPAANDGQAYYGPRDTAHPGSNHHRSRVAGKPPLCVVQPGNLALGAPP
ncbi:hypothetical protein H4Q26_011014 [Puccinia striiformis f. sp. tritici PST-130]|nr:hypothetical protein H4Q26_011014 [Puccinia striiformis f. sp. tritici PST-130]